MTKHKSDDPVTMLHDYNIDLINREIHLVGEDEYVDPSDPGGEPGVEFSMASRFIRNMRVLDTQSTNPILINMKTCGGDWTEGMAIYNMIQAARSPITILNYSHARSMSSIIFQAADKRVMMPDSYFLFHDGTFSSSGTIKQAMSEMAELSKQADRMAEIYVDQMKRKGKFKHRSRKYIKAWLREQMDAKEDVYLSAKEAVEYGLADEIFGEHGEFDWDSLLVYE